MLYRLLQQASQAEPERIAVACGELRLSYRELLRTVDRTARAFQAAGLATGQCVALALENSPAFVVAWIAAAKVRAITLALNPQLADDALKRQLRDASPHLFVTTPRTRARCVRLLEDEARPGPLSRLELDELGDNPSAPAARRPPLAEARRVAGEQPSAARHESFSGPAMYLYTSGSEGSNKRICRTQENLRFEALNFVASAKLAPTDTVLCLVPLYHSYGLGNGLLAAIGAHATLVLLPARTDRTGADLPFPARAREVLALVQRERLRLLVAVAYQYEVLAQVPSVEAGGSVREPIEPQASEAMAAVRLCLCSGNKLPRAVYERFYTRFGVPVRQLYGSTETGSVAVNLATGPAFDPDAVGTCLENVIVEVVDEDGQRLPAGERGHVRVRSPVLPPAGYDGRPEESRAAFVDGFYRTGDEGSLSEDGVLRILGRKQTFIETAGYKVDPKKVEAVLLRHEAVREAVVLGVDSAELGQLVRAVVAAPSELDPASLRQHCSEHLSGYEVPREIEIRSELPRNALGKIVKERLYGDARAQTTQPGSRARSPQRPEAFVLSLDGSRALDRMSYRVCSMGSPGPGEVTIQVLAVGLNFLDVLTALGEIPDDVPRGSLETPRLGSECCGRVVALGEGVSELNLGEEVIALYPGCLASHVTLSAALVVPRPRELSVAAAAGLAVAHVTAHYALVHVAKLARGERLLLHAAAGGVGLAALQVARHLGAEVIATAGSPRKRAHLESLGVSDILDSRSLAFADAIKERGTPIDVVLNSLAGPFIPASLSLLGEWGRFIELGKRDYYADRGLPSRPFLSGLSFTLVDLRRMLFSRPEQVQGLLREVTALAAAGVYRPHLDRVIPASSTLSAFQYMAGAKQIGKVVLDLSEPSLEVLPARSESEDLSSAVRAELAKLNPSGRSAELVTRIRAELAATLGKEAEALAGQRTLEGLGLDSLTTIMLNNRLGALTGLRLPVTFLWEHPEFDRLARALLDRLALANTDPSQHSPFDSPERATRARHERKTPADDAVAIVGIGCRLPGGIRSPDGLWDALCRGQDAIGQVPLGRWNSELLRAYLDREPGLVRPDRGGFLDGIESFDADFFELSGPEVTMMDPQQRLLLELSWEALEDAAIAAPTLRESATGVFLGMSFADYGLRAQYPRSFTGIDPYSSTGNAFSVAAGRISHFLGLAGPSVAVDTACSSSLTAVHLACQSLRSGECSLALAGGVNLIVEPHASLALSRMGALAPDGRCKPFDAAADGIVRSEGCALVVLKPLRLALRDEDRIYALIRGSASNQDGRSNGLTAPNGHAQRALLRQALADAGVHPHTVGFVEAHGTGTSLGDPIELSALGDVLASGRPRQEPLIVGALKGNLGHTEACAGVAGLIKAALSICHGSIPANLHFRTPSPRIPWERWPIRVPTAQTAWPAGTTRVAGVSAFGFSGTNVHVVLAAAQ